MLKSFGCFSLSNFACQFPVFVDMNSDGEKVKSVLNMLKIKRERKKTFLADAFNFSTIKMVIMMMVRAAVRKQVHNWQAYKVKFVQVCPSFLNIKLFFFLEIHLFLMDDLYVCKSL